MRAALILAIVALVAVGCSDAPLTSDGGEIRDHAASDGVSDIARGYHGQWTRDGRVVYVDVEEGGVWRMRADGTEKEQLIETEAESLGLIVSPDRSKLLVMHAGGNFVGDVDGHRLRPIADVPQSGTAQWSDDGSMISFERLDGTKRSIWTVPAGGGRPRVLFDDFGGFVLAWAPDGRMVVRAFRERAGGSYRATLLARPGMAPTPLLRPGWMLDDARFRADGKVEGTEEQGTLVVVDPANRKVRPFPAPERVLSLPDRSPDKRWIVYQGATGVWLAHADGSGTRRLTREECVLPSFSPDGTRIVCSHLAYTGEENEYGDPVFERYVAVIPVPGV